MILLVSEEYSRSKPPAADPCEEPSGSNLRRAYSLNDDSHRGVSFFKCGSRMALRYFCSWLDICSDAHAENTASFTMTSAPELRFLRSPIAPVSESSVQILVLEENGHSRNILEKSSSADTRSRSIRPMRSASVTMPVEMNVAHTLIASAARAGDESEAKAGVRAELICA